MDLLKRRFFLWCERTGVRPSELVLAGVFALLILTFSADALRPDEAVSPFDASTYADFESQFTARAARARHDDSVRTARFHHPEAFLAAEARTAPARSSAKAKKSAVPAGPVAINSAGVAELERIPGVGPKTAADIFAYRQANGPFTSVDDLLKIKGIGPKKLEKMKPHVRL